LNLIPKDIFPSDTFWFEAFESSFEKKNYCLIEEIIFCLNNFPLNIFKETTLEKKYTLCHKNLFGG
jgi:hypothetical protein